MQIELYCVAAKVALTPNRQKASDSTVFVHVDVEYLKKTVQFANDADCASAHPNNYYNNSCQKSSIKQSKPTLPNRKQNTKITANWFLQLSIAGTGQLK